MITGKACFLKALVPSLSLSEPSCNICGGLSGIQRGCFHLFFTSSASPAHWEGRPSQAPLDCVDPRRGNPSPSESKRQVPVAQRNLGKARDPTWSPAHQTGQNLGLNSGLLQEAEWESDQLLSKPPFGVKMCLSGSVDRVEVLCCVKICESASLR
jgi:hypothetical protein